MVHTSSDDPSESRRTRASSIHASKAVRWLINAGFTALACAILVGTGLRVHAGLAQDSSARSGKSSVPGTDRTSFQLFAAAEPTTVLNANALTCGIDNGGSICAPGLIDAPGNAGAYWPGLAGQYMFGSGLQFAGINSAGAGPWTGDTVAAYFFDERGSQLHGSPLTPVFDSRRPEDVAEWPPEARISDTDLFPPSLIGEIAASEQDSWVQYWDGDPEGPSFRRRAFGDHPMGIKVTQRSLAWHTPLGNESIIYFIIDFENVTADPDFQELNELDYFGGADVLPDAGWTIDSVYAAVTSDPDVTSNATQNFTAAVLPLDIGFAYHGGFLDQSQTYPPDFFRPPFFRGVPGFIGVKFLRTPLDDRTGRDDGIHVWTQGLNPSASGPFVLSPLGPQQLWRVLSGRFDASLTGSGCPVPATTPNDHPVCFVFQQASDAVFYQSTGPFSLDPGETETLVFAWIAAAAVETMPDGSLSGILVRQSSANANPPGIPSFHPGFASERGCDANGQNCTVVLSAAQNAPTPIDRATGWYRYTGPPPADALETSANKLDLFRVDVVPESLLGKALLAQTVFDNKFLLAAPPEPPPFFLAPGDNNVTILWDRSATEVLGDPFFSVASDSTSALFNPNYRQFDVEGYRVFRGTTPDNIVQIAQFDYESTSFTDYLCETVLPNENVGVTIPINGVPTNVTGYAAGEPCPLGTAPLARDIGPGNSLPSGQTFNMVFNNGGAGGPPGGGVVRLLTGAATATQLDTALSAAPTLLQNNGVPFVLVDEAVTNNFTYFYSVSTFDINSQASGQISLESARTTKQTVPRAFAPNLSAAFEAVIGVTGDDGVPLVTNELNVQPDPITGVFPGPQPPTNSTEFLLVPDPSLVGGLLDVGGLSGTIDSVVNGAGAAGECPVGTNALGACWTVYMSFTNAASGDVTEAAANGWTPVWDSFGDPDFTVFSMGAGSLPWNDESLQRYGIPAGFGSGVAASVSGRFGMSINYSAFEGQANRRGIIDGSVAGGSRWFDGETEAVAHPTLFIGAGQLTGIDSVWKPVHHTPIDIAGATYPASGQMQCWGYTIAPLGRAADVRVTWGGGNFSEVRDITHNVDVPFSGSGGPTYGFLTTDNNANGFYDWQDFDFVRGVAQNVATLGFCDASFTTPVEVPLTASPVLGPTSTQGNNVGSMAATGNGFAFHINAERYIFETSSLPSDGTVWTLRTYTGVIGTSGPLGAPTDYTLTGGDSNEGVNRPPMISGLNFRLSITDAGIVSSGKPDLRAIHTVPDPYLGSSRFDLAPTERQLMFVNMPDRCTLRIYSLSGVLIKNINYSDQSGGGRLAWDMTNRSGQVIASGVYFFQVTTPEGDEHVGKFTVVTGESGF